MVALGSGRQTSLEHMPCMVLGETRACPPVRNDREVFALHDSPRVGAHRRVHTAGGNGHHSHWRIQLGRKIEFMALLHKNVDASTDVTAQLPFLEVGRGAKQQPHNVHVCLSYARQGIRGRLALYAWGKFRAAQHTARFACLDFWTCDGHLLKGAVQEAIRALHPFHAVNDRIIRIVLTNHECTNGASAGLPQDITSHALSGNDSTVFQALRLALGSLASAPPGHVKLTAIRSTGLFV